MPVTERGTMIRISFKLREDQYRFLMVLAQKKGTTISQTLRDIIDEQMVAHRLENDRGEVIRVGRG